MPESKSPSDVLAHIARRLPPDAAAAQLHDAVIRLLQQDFATAEPILKETLAALPRDARALALVATAVRECAFQQSQSLPALRRPTLLATPEWAAAPEFLLALAEAELTAADPATALSRAEERLTRDPRDGRALRIAAEALEQLGRPAAALDFAGRWIASETEAESFAPAVKLIERLRNADGGLPLPAGLAPARVALIGNVTLNYLKDALRFAAPSEGLLVDATIGEFDQYRQELLDPASRIHAFHPDALVIVLDWREVLPQLYLANLASDPAAIRAQVRAEVGQIAAAVRAFRERCPAAILLTGPIAPTASPLGFLDAAHERGLGELFRYLDELLADLASIPGVYIQQTDRLLAAAGKAASLSAKMNYLGRMPFTPRGLQLLARDFASFIRQARGKARKCLVLDLDNTLWGGIIGEDGLEGIKLGHDGIGRAFADFQREILRLHEQGVILAICSKNNEADAIEAFQQHPDMVLKLDHFAAWRINWIDKPSNMKSLAEEINIGIDSLVFLDDNPIERGAVRQLAPEVLVPELPRDPAEYPEFIRNLTRFATLQLTDEDLKRGRFYAGERQRKTLQESAGNLDDYLQALAMVLHITPIDDFTRPRIVQLIHRTNQFNLTTRRHSEVDVLNMTPERGFYVCSIRLEDRYGDNGTVGVAILRLTDDDPAFPGQRVAVLDTLLMSCRILGRNVEKMFLAHLAEAAVERGAAALIGEFIPSKKNQMAADFYRKFGFDALPPSETTQRWVFPVAERRIERPPYITIRDPQPEPLAKAGS